MAWPAHQRGTAGGLSRPPAPQHLPTAAPHPCPLPGSLDCEPLDLGTPHSRVPGLARPRGCVTKATGVLRRRKSPQIRGGGRLPPPQGTASRAPWALRPQVGRPHRSRGWQAGLQVSRSAGRGVFVAPWPPRKPPAPRTAPAPGPGPPLPPRAEGPVDPAEGRGGRGERGPPPGRLRALRGARRRRWAGALSHRGRGEQRWAWGLSGRGDRTALACPLRPRK